MVKTTRAQREALFRVFQRDFPSWVSPGKRISASQLRPVPTVQWRRFRKLVQPEIGGYGAVMLPWKGMWLGIEKDGYTHS
jgi:hypothetical protein